MRSLRLYFIHTLVLITVSGRAIAQADSSKVRLKKNEIGLNVGPLILLSLGGSPYAQPPGITYKRVQGKVAVRLNYTIKPDNEQGYGDNSTTSAMTDSTITLNIMSRSTNKRIGRAGAEYRHQLKGGWFLVGGLDASGQYTRTLNQINQMTLRIDYISNPGTADQSYHTSFKETKSLLYQAVIAKQVGAGLSIAAMIPLKKRWLLAAQMRADAFFGRSTITTTDHVAGTTTTTTRRNNSIDWGPAVSELSVFYRW